MTPLTSVSKTDDDAHLPPRLRQRLAAIDDEFQSAIRDEAPDHALYRELAYAAMAVVASSHQIARAAFSNLAMFKINAGAMVDRHGRLGQLMFLILPIVVVTEIALAFNGIRFSLGRLGEIDSPFDDPLSLLAATGFALITLKLAYTAALQFTHAERACMSEPGAPVARVDPGLPRLLTDPEGKHLVRPHPLELGDTAEPAGPAATYPATSPTTNDEDSEAKRYWHVFCDGRSRRLRLTVATILVSTGLGLWSANGVMRAEYNTAVRATANAATPSQAFGESGPVGAERGDANDTLENVLVALGLLLFIAMTATMTGAFSPLRLRERGLEGEANTAAKNLKRAIKHARKPIREYEASRGAIIYAEKHAENMATTAGAEEDAA
jgi:hypothetical protein